jgi:hypothetical protein
MRLVDGDLAYPRIRAERGQRREPYQGKGAESASSPAAVSATSAALSRVATIAASSRTIHPPARS